MSLNVSKIHDMVELYAGQAGSTSKHRIKPALILELINIKLRDFVARSHCIESTWSISATASTMEYELPTTVLHVHQVHYDGKRAFKMIHEQEAELSGDIS